jgi:hypothetical protein
MKKLLYYFLSITSVSLFSRCGNPATSDDWDSPNDKVITYKSRIDSTKKIIYVGGLHPYSYWYWQRIYIPSYRVTEHFSEDFEGSSVSERGGFGEHGMNGRAGG